MSNILKDLESTAAIPATLAAVKSTRPIQLTSHQAEANIRIHLVAANIPARLMERRQNIQSPRMERRQNIQSPRMERRPNIQSLRMEKGPASIPSPVTWNIRRHPTSLARRPTIIRRLTERDIRQAHPREVTEAAGRHRRRPDIMGDLSWPVTLEIITNRLIHLDIPKQRLTSQVTAVNAHKIKISPKKKRKRKSRNCPRATPNRFITK